MPDIERMLTDLTNTDTLGYPDTSLYRPCYLHRTIQTEQSALTPDPVQQLRTAATVYDAQRLDNPNNSTLSYPNTVVHFLRGKDDPTSAYKQVEYFWKAVRSAKTPSSLRHSDLFIPAGHTVQASPVGADRMRALLIEPVEGTCR